MSKLKTKPITISTNGYKPRCNKQNFKVGTKKHCESKKGKICNLSHLSNIGVSYCIFSVIGGWRDSGTHSSQSSSISCRQATKRHCSFSFFLINLHHYLIKIKKKKKLYFLQRSNQNSLF